MKDDREKLLRRLKEIVRDKPAKQADDRAKRFRLVKKMLSDQPPYKKEDLEKNSPQFRCNIINYRKDGGK